MDDPMYDGGVMVYLGDAILYATLPRIRVSYVPFDGC